MEAEVAVFRNSERIPILLSPIHRPVGLIICQNVFSRCAVVAAEIPRSPTLMSEVFYHGGILVTDNTNSWYFSQRW